MTEHPMFQFAIALFIGALVGLEREKRKSADNKGGIGGLRTFVLFAEAGAVGAWLARHLESPNIFVGAGLVVAALLVAGYLQDVEQHPGDYGLTTEVAALVVFLLGGMVIFGFTTIAVALAIATSAALAWKRPLHAFARGIGEDDLYAALKLLMATFIVLPVLPNQTLDPLAAFNPYKVWLLVVLISALSLVGYAAARLLGEHKGLVVTGLAGGLVSSTAVTLAFARRSRDAGGEGTSAALSAGLLVAWAVALLRVGVIVAALHQGLAWSLAWPLAALTATTLVAAAVFARQSHRQTTTVDVPLKNPFSLTSAIQFAGLFTAILVLVKLGQQYLPSSAILVVAAAAGATDVDAITLSMAELARTTGDVATPGLAIAVAVVSNTAFKCATAAFLGTAALRRRILLATGVMLLVAIAVVVS